MKLIPLGTTSRAKQNGFAMVDDEDYDYLMKWRWYMRKEKSKLYAATTVGGVKIRMHRLLLKICSTSMICDHKDGNGLNNQKSNLRIATASQNNSNRGKQRGESTKYKGVCRINHWSIHKLKDGTVKKYNYIKYYSRIYVNKKLMFHKLFDNEKDAAIAYNEAAIKYHGEFAKLNII